MKEIYMKRHEGLVVKGLKNKVCKPVKPFYGLKHALKQLYEKFDHTMLLNEFKINGCDTFIYMLKPWIKSISLFTYMLMIC